MFEHEEVPLIEDYFRNKENFDVLEEVLDRETQVYNKDNENELFAEMIPAFQKKEVPALLADAQQFVNQFLDVDHVPAPRLSFQTSKKMRALRSAGVFGLFVAATEATRLGLGVSNSIAEELFVLLPALAICGVPLLLPESKLSDYTLGSINIHSSAMVPYRLPVTLAHEYAHHVQIELDDGFFVRQSPIAEGFAAGIGSAYSRELNNRTGDELHSVFDRILKIPYLKSGYRAISEQIGLNPKQTLLDNHIPEAPVGSHVFGGVLFAVAERVNGPRIYSDFVHGRRDFLKAA